MNDLEISGALNAAADEIKIEVAKYEPARARPVEPQSIFRSEEVAEQYQEGEGPNSQPKKEENRGALSRWFSKFKRR